jgi:hypothetical protein
MANYWKTFGLLRKVLFQIRSRHEEWFQVRWYDVIVEIFWYGRHGLSKDALTRWQCFVQAQGYIDAIFHEDYTEILTKG